MTVQELDKLCPAQSMFRMLLGRIPRNKGPRGIANYLCRIAPKLRPYVRLKVADYVEASAGKIGDKKSIFTRLFISPKDCKKVVDAFRSSMVTEIVICRDSDCAMYGPDGWDDFVSDFTHYFFREIDQAEAAINDLGLTDCSVKTVLKPQESFPKVAR